MTCDQSRRLVLRHVGLEDGSAADVEIADGTIASVATDAERGTCDAAGAEELDLDGYLLLPSPVESHAHLDKALLGSRAANPSGELGEAIRAITAAYATMTAEDVDRRARRAVAKALAHGCTAIRTHADCGVGIGSRGVRALVRLRDRLEGLVTIQVVALARILTGPEGKENRATLAECMDAGADLVGGCPSLEPDPDAALGMLLALASEHGTGVDLHMDETTVPEVLVLPRLAEWIRSSGFAGAVTASHCVSLGVQDAATAREVSRAVAETGIGVVTLPQTNLYLQGRDEPQRTPRGLTAIGALRTAGVVVAAGGDNWQDPFNPLGRVDPLETASLLVAAGHRTPAEAYRAVSADARTVLGLPPVSIAPGSPADLMAIRADTLEQAVAEATEDRVVISAGRVVARTCVSRTVDSRLAEAL